jgi:hypothetical protein
VGNPLAAWRNFVENLLKGLAHIGIRLCTRTAPCTKTGAAAQKA